MNNLLENKIGNSKMAILVIISLHLNKFNTFPYNFYGKMCFFTLVSYCWVDKYIPKIDNRGALKKCSTCTKMKIFNLAETKFLSHAVAIRECFCKLGLFF